MSESGPNNRRLARVPLNVDVNVQSESNFWTGFAADLSGGGVFVSTLTLLPIGSEVMLQLSFPPDAAVHHLKGVVRWTRDPSVASEGLPAGLGVQFVDLPDEVKAKVQAFILGERDSLFYDDDDDV